jgi:group I intron endonuclease
MNKRKQTLTSKALKLIPIRFPRLKAEGIMRFPCYFGIIYKAHNWFENKDYVGKTTGRLKGRFQGHLKSFAKKSARNKLGFLHALRQHPEHFWVSIISATDDLKSLNAEERYWIKKLDCMAPKGYNLTQGGEGIKGAKRPDLAERNRKGKGKRLSAKHRKLISISLTGMKRAPLSPEQRKHLSIINTGKKLSRKTRAKMSKSKLENQNAKGSHSNLGKKHNKESIEHMRSGAIKRWSDSREREKVRKARIGKHHTKETKLKMSESQKIRYTDPKERKKTRLAGLGRKRSLETCIKQSKAAKVRWKRERLRRKRNE